MVKLLVEYQMSRFSWAMFTMSSDLKSCLADHVAQAAAVALVVCAGWGLVRSGWSASAWSVLWKW